MVRNLFSMGAAAANGGSRASKVSSVLHRAVSTVLLESRLGVQLGITVLNVEVSANMRNATIFVAISNDDKITQLRELNNNSHIIRSSLRKSVYLKYIPELLFKIDDEFEAAERLQDLMKREGL